MKLFTSLLIVLIQLIYIPPLQKAHAASNPTLGEAASFAILSGTYTNTAGGTTINGDLGYTTGPAVAPTVNGTTYSPPSTKYTQAGTDQASALSSLNSQLPCDFSYAAGAIDLATDVTTPDGVGQFTPGIYCITGAASIGGGGTITLTGSGTYIFRMTGALTTSANSIVELAGGASACDVFWTPGAATTLGANSTFVGTDIDASGITIGSTVNWTGRALAFGGTVTTDTDTITSSSCTAATSTGSSSSSTTSSDPSSSTGGTNGGPDLNRYIAPSILESGRIDSDSIFISWGPYSGIDTFIVDYGFENGIFLYSTNVTGFSTTINDLPANLPIWARIAVRDGNSIGEYGDAKLVGGPRLPNAGFAAVSVKNKIPPKFPFGIGVGMSFRHWKFM